MDFGAAICNQAPLSPPPARLSPPSSAYAFHNPYNLILKLKNLSQQHDYGGVLRCFFAKFYSALFIRRNRVRKDLLCCLSVRLLNAVNIKARQNSQTMEMRYAENSTSASSLVEIIIFLHNFLTFLTIWRCENSADLTP